MTDPQYINCLVVILMSALLGYLIRNIPLRWSGYAVGLGVLFLATGLIKPALSDTTIVDAYTLDVFSPMMIGVILIGYPLTISGLFWGVVVIIRR